ncbi:MAG: FAD/NAD(P)-binding oxidoreductase, partial [Campylobacterota bacterium]|nr:FAD/NAD(P)-binding oxidoreductase [Campylobacterota bacterium]
MKTTNSRRNFMKFVGLSSLATLTPVVANTSSAPHIVVVGGGFAGATCAKYLKLWGGESVNVTIIDPNATYVSPILSNLVLNGQKSTSDLSFNYNTHKSKYAINTIHSSVVDI